MNCGNPSLKCFYDPSCSTSGGVGCNAGGVGQNCRFCDTGGGAPACPTGLLQSGTAAEVVRDGGHDAVNGEWYPYPTPTPWPTPPSLLPCQYAPVTMNCGNPSLKCFYDPSCSTSGGVGCNAGGVGQNCRFCDTGGGAPACPTGLLQSGTAAQVVRDGGNDA